MNEVETETKTAHTRPGNRVLIIGLDAATFDLIEPWVQQGYLPNFAQLMAEGAYGRLASTLQPTTAPAWVTFMTGMNQGKHGLYDFVRRRSDSYSLDVTNSSHIKAPLMFETLSELGQRIITVNIPYTYPPRPINGIMIGGPFAPAVTPELVYPQEYFDTLKQIVPDYFILPDYDAHAADPMADFAERLYHEVELREQVALHLIRTQAWGVLAVVAMATDEVQHSFWMCQEASDDSPLARYRHVIRRIYQRCDDMLGKLIDAAREAEPLTNVIVLSDHGAGPFRWMINLNQWLAEQGLLKFRAERISPIKQLRLTAIQRAARAYRRHAPPRLRAAIRNRVGSDRFSRVQQEFQSTLLTTTIDWPHTQAFSLGAGGNLYINLKGREPSGAVVSEDYDHVRQRIIDALMQLRSPETGETIVRRAYRREELYHGAQLDTAPDIIIAWADHTFWGRGYYGSQVPVFERQEHFDFSAQPLSGAHRPEGILLAHGPAIQPGARVQDAKLYDLAPTIFHLLGFEPPADMDGRVLTEMLREVKTDLVQTTQEAARTFSPADYTAEEAELISEHLRALGYL